MMTKKEYDLYANLGTVKENEDIVVVQNLVNWLISCLYDPDPELIKKVNIKKIKDFKDEPINWGDLHCYEVKKAHDSTYIAFIQEASPECPKFKSYIENWMKKWGWNVIVITEW